MRLTFPEAQHADVTLASGRVVIGGAADCDVVLEHPSVRAQHVSVDRHPQRGLSLAVLDASAKVHVNGRPVHEFSFLRAGDCIAIGNVRVELVADVVDALPSWARGEPPAIDPQASGAAARVVLRGVSGKYYGKTIALSASPVVGSNPSAELCLDDAGIAARQARVELWPNAVVLRALERGEGGRLNGQSVSNAEIRHGDQLVFDRHRFVLEAPGLPAQPPARRPITGVHEAVPDKAGAAAADPASTSGSAGSGNTLWWLIGAAALIAAVFASLVY